MHIYRGYDVGSEHYLLMSKVAIPDLGVKNNIIAGTEETNKTYFF